LPYPKYVDNLGIELSKIVYDKLLKKFKNKYEEEK
jgi:hypothetical protein